MIVKLLSKIRKDKKMTKMEICKKAGIDMGYMTHIEKGERNPSIQTIKKICKSLDTPYQQVLYTYDISLNDEQIKYNVIDHISYNKIPAFELVPSLIECPTNVSNATVAIKVSDKSMEPVLKLNSYVFVAFNLPLDHKDIGIFEYNNKIIIRRFLIRKKHLVLRAENEKIDDVIISEDDNFIIIGKIVGTSE
ncbi:MAG TPA: XRE family transcriptional regulator [Clostridiaceae bacterium]|jgi:transcriptional regulator with XRE-family HTH domain|nr:XRE family transcriptional regulator [Clostridiaceae bacterium]